MHLVILAWLYVTLMMAVAEAMSPVGTVLGAVFTFLLYGVLPMLIVAYILGTPARRRARTAQVLMALTNSEVTTANQAPTRDHTPPSGAAPDAGGKATAATIASVREETP